MITQCTGRFLGARISFRRGLHAWLSVKKKSAYVLSDSGMVQEESPIFKAVNVPLHDVTECCKTIECDNNI